jgi:archaellum component FlaC
MMDNLLKQSQEMGIMRKYSTQINNGIRGITETIKSLGDTQKEIKKSTEELTVSKDIANALASVSGNIKLLDKIVGSLRQSIEELKRRSKHANQ